MKNTFFYQTLNPIEKCGLLFLIFLSYEYSLCILLDHYLEIDQNLILLFNIIILIIIDSSFLIFYNIHRLKEKDKLQKVKDSLKIRYKQLIFQLKEIINYCTKIKNRPIEIMTLLSLFFITLLLISSLFFIANQIINKDITKTDFEFSIIPGTTTNTQTDLYIGLRIYNSGQSNNFTLRSYQNESHLLYDSKLFIFHLEERVINLQISLFDNSSLITFVLNTDILSRELFIWMNS